VSTAGGADHGPEVLPDDWTAAAGPFDPALPAVRPGPAVLDADSWEEHGVRARTVEMYEGRRRASRSPVPVRTWLVMGLVLLGLGAVVAIPLTLWAHRGDSAPAAAPTASGEATAGQTLPGVSLVPATGAAPAPATTAKPRPSQTTPAFSVTLEAEARDVQLNGSARVDDYPGASGGAIVRNVGKWSGNPGTVRFTVTLPVAGPYVITIWYVHVDVDGEQTRSAQINVSGADAVTRSFTGSSTCCASLALNPITLSEGSHTVTIASPSGRGPSIDKISIARA
jgi:hypothetical protein